MWVLPICSAEHEKVTILKQVNDIRVEKEKSEFLFQVRTRSVVCFLINIHL